MMCREVLLVLLFEVEVKGQVKVIIGVSCSPQSSTSSSVCLVTFLERPHLNCLSQDDPELVEAFKEHYLLPPSTLPYNFQVPTVQKER
jgi:hypothetical protein